MKIATLSAPDPVSTSPAALRLIATLEATKGVFVLLLALGVFGLVRDGSVESATDSLLIHLHINPERRLARVLIDASIRLTDARLWEAAAAAVAYSAVRFTEAWGLWRNRAWAQWFSLLSGTVYLPWEFTAWAKHRTWMHAALIAANVAVLLYMLSLRLRRPASE